MDANPVRKSPAGSTKKNAVPKVVEENYMDANRVCKSPAGSMKKNAVVKYRPFRTLCTPIKFFDHVQQLTKSQIEVVTKMGFGGLLHVKMHYMNRKLIKWVADRFNTSNDTLKLPNGEEILISQTDLARSFNLPHSGESIKSYTEKEQLKATSWGTLLKRFDKIGSGTRFRTWFLQFLFCTLLAPTTKQSGCNNLYTAIKYYIHWNPSRYNWAAYVFNRLREGIMDWQTSGEASNAQFTGCIYFLQVVYMLKLKAPSFDKSVTVWHAASITNMLLSERLSFEVNEYGEYGVGVVVVDIEPPPTELIDGQTNNSVDTQFEVTPVGPSKNVPISVEQLLSGMRTRQKQLKAIRKQLDDALGDLIASHESDMKQIGAALGRRQMSTTQLNVESVESKEDEVMLAAEMPQVPIVPPSFNLFDDEPSDEQMRDALEAAEVDLKQKGKALDCLTPTGSGSGSGSRELNIQRGLIQMQRRIAPALQKILSDKSSEDTRPAFSHYGQPVNRDTGFLVPLDSKVHAKETKDRPIVPKKNFSRLGWIVRLNTAHSKNLFYAKTKLPMMKFDWDAAHYIFSPNEDISGVVLVRFGDVVLTRANIRTLEPSNIVDISVVETFVELCNIQNTIQCEERGFSSIYYFSPSFSREMWSLGNGGDDANTLCYLQQELMKSEISKNFNGMMVFPHNIDGHWSFHVVSPKFGEIYSYETVESTKCTAHKTKFSLKLRSEVRHIIRQKWPLVDTADYVMVDAPCPALPTSQSSGVLMMMLIEHLSHRSYSVRGVINVDAQLMDFCRVTMAVKLLKNPSNHYWSIAEKEVNSSHTRNV